AERIELCREDEENEKERESHRGEELATLLAQLARLAGVVDAIPLRQDPRRGVLEDAQPLVERARGAAEDLDRVQLLEAVQRARLDALAQRGDRAERHQLAVRPGDVDLVQLLGGEPPRALDLRDDLVAPAVDGEAIDEVAAQHRR